MMTSTPTAPRARRSTAELQQVVEQAQSRLTDRPLEDVLTWAGEEFGAGLAVACSMAADTVLPHLVSQHVPGVDVLFLDTGYHFAETLGTRAAVQHALDVTVVDVRAELDVAAQDAAYGPRLHDRDPGACCAMRKVAPLARALSGYEAWVTGVRREDNALRANTAVVEWDAQHAMVKINPIAAWTFDDVLDYAARHAVPVNDLLAQGYPSIGCEPCTRKVAPGEDPRSGRWAGLAKTECGIHR